MSCRCRRACLGHLNIAFVTVQACAQFVIAETVAIVVIVAPVFPLALLFSFHGILATAATISVRVVDW